MWNVSFDIRIKLHFVSGSDNYKHCYYQLNNLVSSFLKLIKPMFAGGAI
jgi:hypothetical protein